MIRRNSLPSLGRLMIWWRRKPMVPQDALLLDAEFQIMLSELRYPSIYKLYASSVGRSPRTASPPTFTLA
jgi:hypothetical protein